MRASAGGVFARQAAAGELKTKGRAPAAQPAARAAGRARPSAHGERTLARAVPSRLGWHTRGTAHALGGTQPAPLARRSSGSSSGPENAAPPSGRSPPIARAAAAPGAPDRRARRQLAPRERKYPRTRFARFWVQISSHEALPKRARELNAKAPPGFTNRRGFGWGNWLSGMCSEIFIRLRLHGDRRGTPPENTKGSLMCERQPRVVKKTDHKGLTVLFRPRILYPRSTPPRRLPVSPSGGFCVRRYQKRELVVVRPNLGASLHFRRGRFRRAERVDQNIEY